MNRNSEIKARYDAKATKRFGLKLNLKTDADVIEKLEGLAKENGMQGYIKDLIKEDLHRPRFMQALLKMSKEGYEIESVESASGKRIAIMSNVEGERVKIQEVPASDSVAIEKGGDLIDILHP